MRNNRIAIMVVSKSGMAGHWDILGAFLIMGLAVLGLAGRRARGDAPAPEEEAFGDHEPDDVDRAIEFAALQDRARLLDRENLLLRQEIARLQGLADRAVPAALVDDERSMAMMILGLDPDEPFDRDALRRAFSASVKRNHPDAGGSPHTLRMIIRAHDLLMAGFTTQR